MPHVRLTSARGRSYADVIMAVDDVSIDLVNIDQVNGSTRVHGQESAGPTGRSQCATDRRDPHIGARLKEKEKGLGKGQLGYWANSEVSSAQPPNGRLWSKGLARTSGSR